MTQSDYIAVIDIGKTNAKLVVVDAQSLQEVTVTKRSNKVLSGPPWPHFDLDGHWKFLIEHLRLFNQTYPIKAISITTHGASAVLLDEDGQPASPMLDYEFAGPEETAEEYNAIRPKFEETGSPRLGLGLNLGAQLHWMFAQDKGLRDRTKTIVTYPQYWGYRLTGVAACDVSSLGCHTDLWNPNLKTYSTLVEKLGIGEKLAPACTAFDILGPILPDIADQTGLPNSTPVCVGIHDSNASLLPHILSSNQRCSVVSSGTWTIVMSIGARAEALDPKRDTLINVDAYGRPVPSARFMGGREFELALQGKPTEPTDEDVQDALAKHLFLLPALQNDTGPFIGMEPKWTPIEPEVGTGTRTAVVSFYLALTTWQCLQLTGHSGPIIVEGPLANNPAYLEMLSAASQCEVINSASSTGTSIGATLLVMNDSTIEQFGSQNSRLCKDPKFNNYADAWFDCLVSEL